MKKKRSTIESFLYFFETFVSYNDVIPEHLQTRFFFFFFYYHYFWNSVFNPWLQQLLGLSFFSSQTDWIPLASVKLTITEKKYNNKGQPTQINIFTQWRSNL